MSLIDYILPSYIVHRTSYILHLTPYNQFLHLTCYFLPVETIEFEKISIQNRIIEKSLYNEKMSDILSNETTYKALSEEPTEIVKKKIKNLL